MLVLMLCSPRCVRVHTTVYSYPPVVSRAPLERTTRRTVRSARAVFTYTSYNSAVLACVCGSAAAGCW